MALLSVGDCLRQYFPGLSDRGREKMEPVCVLLQGPQPGPRSKYLLPDTGWGGSFWVPQHVCPWINANFCCEGGWTETKNVLFSHDADVISNISTLYLDDPQVFMMVFLSSMDCTLLLSLKSCYSKRIRGPAGWCHFRTCEKCSISGLFPVSLNQNPHLNILPG